LVTIHLVVIGISCGNQVLSVTVSMIFYYQYYNNCNQWQCENAYPTPYVDVMRILA